MRQTRHLHDTRYKTLRKQDIEKKEKKKKDIDKTHYKTLRNQDKTMTKETKH